MRGETSGRLKCPDPTGLVPVVKEVEWGRAQPPLPQRLPPPAQGRRAAIELQLCLTILLLASLAATGCLHTPRPPARVERDIPFVAHPDPNACGIQVARIAVAALEGIPPPPEDDVRDQIFAPALDGTPLPLLIAFLESRGLDVATVPLHARGALASALATPDQLVLAVTPPPHPGQRAHIAVLTGYSRIPRRVRLHTADTPDVWTSWPRLHRSLRQPGGMLLLVSATDPATPE